MVLGNPIGLLLYVFLARKLHMLCCRLLQNHFCDFGWCMWNWYQSMVLTVGIRLVYQMLYAGGSFLFSHTSNQ